MYKIQFIDNFKNLDQYLNQNCLIAYRISHRTLLKARKEKKKPRANKKY